MDSHSGNATAGPSKTPLRSVEYASRDSEERSRNSSRNRTETPKVTTRSQQRNNNNKSKNKGKSKAVVQEYTQEDNPEYMRRRINILEEELSTTRRGFERMEGMMQQLLSMPANSQKTPSNDYQPRPSSERGVNIEEEIEIGGSPVPSIHPFPPRNTSTVPARPRFESEVFTPRYHQSKITEKIDPLDNGDSPTYRQWRISVRDRLLVNADRYDTPVTRKALIWGTTTGLARSYLEPRYQSDSMALAFIDAQDMIELLESYFLTGYETEDARNAFQALQMGGKDHHNETFAEFRGRFTSMAILGEIPASEQFYYMWEKITPQLRSSAAPLKRRWNYNFAEMAADLLALDKEKKRNTELVAQSSTRAPSVPAPIRKPTTPIPTARSSTPKPFIPFRAVSATPQVTRPFQPRPSTTPGPT